MPIGAITGEAFGLHTHIRNNRIRSRFLLAGLFFLAYLASYGAILLGLGLSGADYADSVFREAGRSFVAMFPFVTLGVMVWIFIGYRANVGIISMMTRAKGLERKDAPRLYAMLEKLCISRGLTMPRLMIVEDPALNAFASGINEKQFTVSVTRGLIETLDDDEIEAVLAHELTHIRNGDVKLMVVAVVIAGVISLVGELAFRSLRVMGHHRPARSSNDKGGGAALAIVVGLALLAVSWILAAVIRFSLSRSREYLADAGAVELTKNPDAMISALLKISGRADLSNVPSAVMDMCFENDPDDVNDLFSTHPSIHKRVQALVRNAGGRLPPSLPEVKDRDSLRQIMDAQPRPWG